VSVQTRPASVSVNAARSPTNQYVRPYVRRDGTFADGWWRNSPSDGPRICRVISCCSVAARFRSTAAG